MKKELFELNSQTKYPKLQTLWTRDEKFKVVSGSLNPKLESLKNIKNFLLGEKMDGTNIGLVITSDKEIYIRKRSKIIAKYNSTMKIGDGKSEHSWTCFEKYNNIKQYLECMKDINFGKILKYFEDSKSLTIIFGEGIGKGIQRNEETKEWLYTDSNDFIVFDIKCGNSYFDWRSLIDFCKKTGLKNANWEKFEGDILKFDWEKELIKRNKKRFFEGFVVRSEPPMLNRFGSRMMFKIKLKDFKTEVEKNKWK